MIIFAHTTTLKMISNTLGLPIVRIKTKNGEISEKSDLQSDMKALNITIKNPENVYAMHKALRQKRLQALRQNHSSDTKILTYLSAQLGCPITELQTQQGIITQTSKLESDVKTLDIKVKNPNNITEIQSALKIKKINHFKTRFNRSKSKLDKVVKKNNSSRLNKRTLKRKVDKVEPKNNSSKLNKRTLKQETKK